MRREQKLKRFDLNTRNQLRAILSDGEGNAIARLTKLSARFGKSQIDTLDEIINSSTLTKAVKKSIPFPKTPQFHDILRADNHANLNEILTSLEVSVAKHRHRLKRLAQSLEYIDECYASKKMMNA
ncbi:hypothetical protein [Enterobacter mori]|uniref:hypothetical protein n=1 Tax=Enterobacter mori TaxID=539813 RepID=UPI002B20A7B1|nr:hypothetical protein [Enterobacter mori]MEA5204958.1 hypothetical protein [Enterobacter mori]